MILNNGPAAYVILIIIISVFVDQLHFLNVNLLFGMTRTVREVTTDKKINNNKWSVYDNKPLVSLDHRLEILLSRCIRKYHRKIKAYVSAFISINQFSNYHAMCSLSYAIL